MQSWYMKMDHELNLVSTTAHAEEGLSWRELCLLSKALVLINICCHSCLKSILESGRVYINKRNILFKLQLGVLTRHHRHNKTLFTPAPIAKQENSPCQERKACLSEPHTQLPPWALPAPLIISRLGTQHRSGKKAGKGRTGRA